MKFKNPKSGRRFRFDGYFSEIGLIVEFHGHQHYTFPNIYTKTEQNYLDLRERDRIKEEMIRNTPGLIYIKILEDEPFNNLEYIRERLIEIGVLKS